ncbi:lamb YcsF family protein [Suillus paluster]|uniref:lamb YcsF family protein n=1 Tax=Suillus paluster TaxID=48578 RepID=UPI001B868020|nr:lamb YcsF family protein [Suillus paluster]KAG1722453.1 lamb YcsF family protein [Suillus paluster]
MSKPLKATVNCDMGEGFSLYTMGDDEGLMKTIHLANIACGFHASDFSVMNKTVALAKSNNVLVGAHPSLPDLQGFGRREMAIEPESCFIYQVGALDGFLKRYGLPMNHIKPHGSVYGQTARSIDPRTGSSSAAGPQGVAFMGLAGTAHQQATEELGVPFIAEWFADLDYNDEGKLLITKKHDPVPIEVVRQRVKNLLKLHKVSTVGGKLLDIGANVTEVSICCHSDTPGAVEIAQAVKALVDESNREAGYV